MALCSLFFVAAGKVYAQRPVHRFIGPHEVIINLQVSELFPELLAEGIEILEVIAADLLGIKN